MSLSKLGLPAIRTGIVIADSPVIELLTEMNAVINLTSTSPALVGLAPLFESGEILTLCNQHIKPFYENRVATAMTCFHDAFNDLPVRVHRPEGAIFFWLWFEGLPISSQQLYEQLKTRGVVVVSGHHFFPDWMLVRMPTGYTNMSAYVSTLQALKMKSSLA